MNGLIGKLRRIFFGTPARPQQVMLPPEILERLSSHHGIGEISAYVQQVLKRNKLAPEVDWILAEVKRLEWPANDIEKLTIYIHYYQGEIKPAFDRAARFLEERGFDPEIFIIAAFSLYQAGQFEDAFRFLGDAKGREELFAKRVDYFLVVALIAWANNRLDEMKEAIDHARRIQPNNYEAALCAHGMYFELGDVDAFAQARQQILDGRPKSVETDYVLAHFELAQDNYPEGFRLLEARYNHPEAHRYLNQACFNAPRWQGENITGKTLLISAEQGLGDTIMMARYLPEVLRLGARVVMETQPETLTLLQYNFPGIEMTPRDWGKLPPFSFDFWIGSMSLPHILGSTPQNIPGKAGYLGIPAENIEYWRKRVSELAHGDRPRIGLTWSGSPTHRADRRRSIPFTRIAEAIRDIQADFFALQTKVPEIRPANLIDVSEEMVIFSDTAALIEQLDLVITIDTSVVHVAGAIGKETWLLLPYRYEWRWGLEGEKNNWYDSVSVLRQPRGGDWNSVLDEVFRQRLRKRFNALEGD